MTFKFQPARVLGMITLYNVTSADGFIADKNGNEDFIPDSLWNDFLDLCSKSDVVVMGHNTYKAIQNYPKELVDSFEELPIERLVISTNHSFTPKNSYKKFISLEEAFKNKQNILVSSGPKLNDSILEKGLANRYILTILPQILGVGIKAYNQDFNKEIISQEDRSDGIKRIIYQIKTS